jgi:uncharacterized membrane protein (UPF0127 family)
VRSRTALIVVLLAAACSQRSAPPPPAAPAPVAQSGPRVIFPDNFTVQVEIAADDPTREQGLMYRDRMADDRGMIFLFAQDGVYPFWMKNTLIPLDMIWIDSMRKVVSVQHDVPPCKADPCPSYPPTGAARYVLETAAGVANKHGVRAGARLRMEGLDSVIVR